MEKGWHKGGGKTRARFPRQSWAESAGAGPPSGATTAEGFEGPSADSSSFTVNEDRDFVVHVELPYQA